jgi:putative transposase
MEVGEAMRLRRLEEENRRLSEHLRSTQRCELRAEDQSALPDRLIALAEQRPRFGYPRLHIPPLHEGFPVNRKCAAPGKRRPMIPAVGANECWSMDLVSDRLDDGRQFRPLTVVHDVVKHCPVLEVDTSISSERVTRALDRAIEAHGKPRRLVMENGPEFTSRALLAWAARRAIELVWVKPASRSRTHTWRPSTRGSRTSPNQPHFLSLDNARDLIESCRQDRHQLRPHTWLGGETPERFFELWSEAVASDQSRVRQRRLAIPSETETSPEPTELVNRLREMAVQNKVGNSFAKTMKAQQPG